MISNNATIVRVEDPTAVLLVPVLARARANSGLRQMQRQSKDTLLLARYMEEKALTSQKTMSKGWGSAPVNYR